MKKILGAALILASFGYMHQAAAFSEDRTANVSEDGAAKYTDPDDQKPGFVVEPQSTGNGTLSFGPRSTTPVMPGDADNGAKAFDQAFGHQGDR